MKRFLGFWIVLASTLVVVTLLSSLLLFRHVDLTYEYFFQLVTVPACQALLVTWATKPRPAISIGQAAQYALAQPLARPLIVMDAVLLSVAWIAPTHHILGIDGGASLIPTWTGVKAIGTGVFLVPAARSITSTNSVHGRAFSAPDRVWLLAFAIGAFVLGLDAFRPWLGELPQLLFPRRPTVLQWLVVYGGLFALATIAALKVEATIERWSAITAVYFDAAIATAWACAWVMVLNGYLRRYPEEPWAALVRTGMSLTATFMFFGAMFSAPPTGAASPVAHADGREPL